MIGIIIAMRSDIIQLTRFIAAFLVLITHSTFYYKERVSADFGVWHFGELGVPLFFAISGLVMVVSTHGAKDGCGAAREFLVRRLIRIVPLYWLATSIKIAIAIAIPAVVLHNHFDFNYSVKSLLFIPAFNSVGEVRPIHGVGWTLLHEMFFYAVFAGLIFLRVSPALFSSLILLCLVLLGQYFDKKNAFLIVLSNPVNLNFIIGIIVGIAVLNKNKQPKKYSLMVVALAGLLVAAFFLNDRWFGSLNPAVLTFAVFIALCYAASVPKSMRLFARLGASSYALYLFHPFIAPGVIRFVGSLFPALSPAIAIGLAMTVTIGVSHFLHLWFERPVMRRLEMMRAKASSNVAAPVS
jgi:exopolysaccharide production protein ExoZ